jgi:hypothetical protein
VAEAVYRLCALTSYTEQSVARIFVYIVRLLAFTLILVAIIDKIASGNLRLNCLNINDL